jgi:hypothetical protein
VSAVHYAPLPAALTPNDPAAAAKAAANASWAFLGGGGALPSLASIGASFDGSNGGHDPSWDPQCMGDWASPSSSGTDGGGGNGADGAAPDSERRAEEAAEEEETGDGGCGCGSGAGGKRRRADAGRAPRVSMARVPRVRWQNAVACVWHIHVLLVLARHALQRTE